MLQIYKYSIKCRVWQVDTQYIIAIASFYFLSQNFDIDQDTWYLFCCFFLVFYHATKAYFSCEKYENDKCPPKTHGDFVQIIISKNPLVWCTVQYIVTIVKNALRDAMQYYNKHDTSIKSKYVKIIQKKSTTHTFKIKYSIITIHWPCNG